jgi:hypothetical protein
MAGLGFYDLDDLYGTGFKFWSLGLEADWRIASVSITYIDTDQTALHLFGTDYAGWRVVASAALRIR